MLKYLKKYWFYVMLAPLFMLGEAGMDLVQPRMMSTIVDEGVLGLSNNHVGDLSIVIHTGIKMILLVTLGGFCGVMSGVFANLCGQNFGNDIRKDAFGKIMHLSFEQTDQFTTGSLVTRVTNDITQIQNLAMQCIRGFVRTFILFAGGICCMFSLNLSFGVVILCALPFVLFTVVYFLKKANPKFTVLQNKLDGINNVMQENVSGARVVKAYVKESYEQRRFQKANDALTDTQLDVLLLLSYMTPIMNIVLNISVVAIIKVGGIEVQAGNITPGNVMAAITYASQILNAVMRMSMIFQTVSRGVASGKRIQELLDCEPAIADAPNPQKPEEKKGKIEFRHVSFRYPGMQETKILDDISLTIQPGETFAILGATGCGKTTLVNLILRFYDVTEGEVLIDGVDVRNYRLQELHDNIALALQKSEIFQTTIYENIAWGRPDATEEEVLHAAECAQAMEFIAQKEDGIHTMVSQGGASLSGGQKQRVAISRALLKKSSILIFDDATSALDLQTEAKLYDALKREHAGKTKIIVAQRIASIKDADRISVIENGKIAAIGSHEELLKNSEIYQDIYRSQQKEGGEKHV